MSDTGFRCTRNRRPVVPGFERAVNLVVFGFQSIEWSFEEVGIRRRVQKRFRVLPGTRGSPEAGQVETTFGLEVR